MNEWGGGKGGELPYGMSPGLGLARWFGMKVLLMGLLEEGNTGTWSGWDASCLQPSTVFSLEHRTGQDRTEHGLTNSSIDWCIPSGYNSAHSLPVIRTANIKLASSGTRFYTKFDKKIDILKWTIPNAACMKTLQIFPSAREWLSIQPSRSRSTRNQSCLHCPQLCQLMWMDLNFCMYEALHTRKVHSNQ